MQVPSGRRAKVSPRVSGLVIGAVALAATSVALAVGPVVTLGMGAGYATRTLTLCGDRHGDSFTFFHRGARIAFAGSVRPKPAKRDWRVKVKVMRCMGKQFHGVWTGHLVGRPDGSFRVIYTARTAGIFAARAYYGQRPELTSGKQRFIVR